MNADLLEAAKALPLPERIELAETLWESITGEGHEPQLTSAQADELDRRLEEHRECGDLERQRPLSYVVVYAGDIDQGTAGLDCAKRTFPKTPVIYVLGNHEFYGHAIPDLTKTVKREANGSHIHVLENNIFEV